MRKCRVRSAEYATIRAARRDGGTKARRDEGEGRGNCQNGRRRPTAGNRESGFEIGDSGAGKWGCSMFGVGLRAPGFGPEQFGPPVATVYPPVLVAGCVMGCGRPGLPPVRCGPWPHPTAATGQCQAINGIASGNHPMPPLLPAKSLPAVYIVCGAGLVSRSRPSLPVTGKRPIPQG